MWFLRLFLVRLGVELVLPIFVWLLLAVALLYAGGVRL